MSEPPDLKRSLSDLMSEMPGLVRDARIHGDSLVSSDPSKVYIRLLVESVALLCAMQARIASDPSRVDMERALIAYDEMQKWATHREERRRLRLVENKPLHDESTKP